MNQKKCCSPQRKEVGDQVKFTHNIELNKSHNVYFDLSQISIFDKKTEQRI